MGNSVLIVEDDESIAELVDKNLRAAGFVTARAASGPAALEMLGRAEFALVVLDIGLPGIDGYEITRRVRQKSKIPILMLTARAADAEKVLGLELGADDYLAKPFSPQEMVARVRAILRRTAPAESDTVLERGNLRIDPARREVRRDGQVVDTTSLEFELLHFLAARPGRVYSRNALLHQVWGSDRIVDARSVDGLVSRLRRKLEVDPAQPRILTTVWGAGYRFHDADS
jgi:DNA-binding response OmpR family regulator